MDFYFIYYNCYLVSIYFGYTLKCMRWCHSVLAKYGIVFGSSKPERKLSLRWFRFV